MGPSTMAVSPTPQQQEYMNDNATEEMDRFWIVGIPRKVHLYDWMDVYSLLIAPLGLAGNCAVLWLLGFRSRRTPFSVYILNLAAADALFLCCSFVVSLMTVDNYHIMYTVVIYVQSMAYCAGLSLLAAISTERCLSALFPLWYRCRRPKRTSATICAGLWAVAGMIEVTEFLTKNYVSPGRFCHNFLIIYFLYFLLLTCVLCVSSLTLLLRVQCSSQHRQPPRLYLLVLLAVLAFLLCGLPWGIGDFINYRFRIDFRPYSISRPLACVNSSVNPFIYFFVGKRGHKGREPLRLVLQRALGEEQEEGGGMRDLPHTNTQETSS